MKKWILITAFLGYISTICSCDSQEHIDGMEDDSIKTVNVLIDPMENEDVLSRVNIDEKAAATWAEKDTIGIFPTVGGQVEFPIINGFGSSDASFTGGGWALKPNYLYHAYYPFNHSNRNVECIPVSYLGQEQDGLAASPREHLSRKFLMAAPPSQAANGYVNFSLRHTAALLNISLTLPEATTYSSMAIYADAEIFPVRKTFNLKTISDAFDIEEEVLEWSDHVTLKLKNFSTETLDQTVNLSMIIPSVSAGTHALNVVVYDINGNVYTGKLLRKDNGNQAYATFSKNKYQNRKASPQLREGFNAGLEDWVIGGEINGTLQ